MPRSRPSCFDPKVLSRIRPIGLRARRALEGLLVGPHESPLKGFSVEFAGYRAYAQSDGFAVFVQTLPLRFYCIFTLFMVVSTILLRREFGPMLQAARRAAEQGKPLADDAQPLVSETLHRVEPPDGARLLARNAVIPILVLIVTTIGLIFWQGSAGLDDEVRARPWYEQVSAILAGGQSQRALCYAGALAVLTLQPRRTKRG